MGEIELFDHLTVCKQMTCLIELFDLHSYTWKHLTVGSFSCVYIQNVLTNHIFKIYVKTGFGTK